MSGCLSEAESLLTFVKPTMTGLLSIRRIGVLLDTKLPL